MHPRDLEKDASSCDGEAAEPLVSRSSTDISDNGVLRKPRRSAFCTHAYLIHLLILACNTILCMLALKGVFSSPSTISNDAVRGLDISIQDAVLHNLSRSAFAGPPPDASIDGAWEALLAPMDMRVSKDELAQSGQSSVALPEGGGNLVWLGVFHELHCIVCGGAVAYSHMSRVLS